MKEDAHRRVGNDRFEGYIADLTAAVAELAKFKFEFRLVGDNAYGSKNATGHWNGMVGEVIDGVSLVFNIFFNFQVLTIFDHILL